jgi:hypothetical protein
MVAGAGRLPARSCRFALGAASTLVAGTDSFPARLSPMAVDDVVALSVVRPAYLR